MARVHDPAPARLLRTLFTEDRTIYRGLVTFDDAWRENVRVALKSVGSQEERKQWAIAFRSTRQAWEDAFEQRGARLRIVSILAERDAALR
jgi:hypothetical protein